jgi:hypothetical protein
MPIAHVANDGAFAPDDIALLTRAFEDACCTLGLTGPRDRGRDIVAKTIIEAAQCGWRRIRFKSKLIGLTCFEIFLVAPSRCHT